MSRKIKNHMELKPRLGTAAVYVNRVSSPSPKAVLGPPFFFLIASHCMKEILLLSLYY